MEVYLQPGDWFAGDASYKIRTVLGSCVSITLWHPRLRVGAMSHFLLPARVGGVSGSGELDGRYADESLIGMLRQLADWGAPAAQCHAKVFGGGNMFPAHARGGATVGQRNGQAALNLLRQHGVQVVGTSLFGVGHRQVIFDCSSGDVWVRQTRPSAFEVEMEAHARQALYEQN